MERKEKRRENRTETKRKRKRENTEWLPTTQYCLTHYVTASPKIVTYDV